MKIKIDYLPDNAQIIQTLARWHYAQWGYLDTSRKMEDVIEKLKSHLGPERIPTTFIACLQNKLLGSASLTQHDMDTHMHLSPWLASVYVDLPFRRQGIGSALIQRTVEEVRSWALQDFFSSRRTRNVSTPIWDGPAWNKQTSGISR